MHSILIANVKKHQLWRGNQHEEGRNGKQNKQKNKTKANTCLRF